MYGFSNPKFRVQFPKIGTTVGGAGLVVVGVVRKSR